ncbi:MAG TPA: peptidoglycan-associated lipoprotein Pal [Candidatus Deferrimicrobiaceae bacterium]
MMKSRTIFHLLFALLLAASLASSGCARRQLTRGEADRLETLETKIAQAEAAGAKECAPRELARAKVAVEHARHESAESFELFNEALVEAEKAVEALLEKMKDCRKTPPGVETGKGPSEPPSANEPPPPPPGPATPPAPPANAPEPPIPSGDASQPAPFRPAPVPVIQKDEGSFENIYFDFDESVIREDAKPILLIVASYLKNNPKYKLVIEGHCDERGTSEYNMALGQRRADATRAYLVNLGISVNRLTTVSYGKERPLLPGHDEEAWARNRRSVFVLQR